MVESKITNDNMKTINLTLFSFDELSENVQKKIIERERWNVMERCMDCYASEYKASLKSFEKLTEEVNKFHLSERKI